TILAYPALHVFAHWRFGGAPQLLRIFHPAPLVPPPPPLDPVELLVLLAERTEAPPAHPAPKPAGQTPRAGPPPPRPRAGDTGGPPPRRGPVLQANPFIVAVSIAIGGAFFLVAVDRNAVDTLHVGRIDVADAPVLDGDTSDPVWRTAPPLHVTTGH